MTGVVLAVGEEIVGAASSCPALDPKRTLVDLADPVTIGPSLRWRAGNFRTPGVVAKVNLVVDRLPRFTAAAGDDEQLLRGRIVVAPGIDAIERAFDAAKYGRVVATRRSSRRRSRRWSIRRSSTARRTGPTS